MAKNINFWIILDHPKQFLLALYLSNLFRKEYHAKTNLLISKHQYWKFFDIENYQKYFGQISWFARLDYPPPAMNKIKQFSAAFLMFLGLLVLRIRLLFMKISGQDVIIGLSLCQFLENMVISLNPRTKSISILSVSEYKHYETKPNPKIFISSLSSKIVFLMMKTFGLKETIYSHRRNLKRLGDGDYYLSYKNSLSKIYSGILLTTTKRNDSEKKPPNQLSKSKNLLIASYPDIRIGKAKTQRHQKIIFLGQPLLMLGNRKLSEYLLVLNKCLEYLRQQYRRKYKLIYKVHPREDSKHLPMDLKGFNIETRKKPAEIYFLDNKDSIKAVFSVSSSASKTAVDAGLDSYLFAKVFPYNKVFIDDLYVVCGDMPKEAFINNLNSRPKSLKYTRRQNNTDFENGLKMLVEK